MLYIVTTEIDAVLIKSSMTEAEVEDVKSILSTVPHYLDSKGLHVAIGETEEDVIACGNYIFIEGDGRLVIIDKDQFEQRATLFDKKDMH